jgi:hypothetical protein
MKIKTPEEIKSYILEQSRKGNIVVSTTQGLETYCLKEFIKQPTEGILYDINRDAATIMTFIEDPKWVNDFAATCVIAELKKQVESVALTSEEVEKAKRMIAERWLGKAVFYKEEGLREFTSYLNALIELVQNEAKAAPKMPTEEKIRYNNDQLLSILETVKKWVLQENAFISTEYIGMLREFLSHLQEPETPVDKDGIGTDNPLQTNE